MKIFTQNFAHIIITKGIKYDQNLVSICLAIAWKLNKGGKQVHRNDGIKLTPTTPTSLSF